ncbi:hypothetical protein DPMN_140701 [Dreissena polymorpha]|uniref:Uncharacterized protein n=1 Tax=Dreissena polymorpha TaxID=45954 RepID=A0A9D4G835_DREPO|nr:hypothetical protein DPMN_140701 [Dreissena polymorpha]
MDIKQIISVIIQRLEVQLNEGQENCILRDRNQNECEDHFRLQEDQHGAGNHQLDTLTITY